MKIKEFKLEEVKERFWRPEEKTEKFDNGQVTIIGGSSLFHGAPVLALKAASRVVGMVYFSTPAAQKEVADRIKAGLASFIWISEEEIDVYVRKSDAVLIGPGMMRSKKEIEGIACDREGEETKMRVLDLWRKFPQKKWVVDGGALQVVRPEELPKRSVITPSRKELAMLFGVEASRDETELAAQVGELAGKWGLTIVYKGPVGVVSDGETTYLIKGGNEGLVKGGVGDVIAGLTAGFLAKNEPLLAAAGAICLVKKAAESLATERGTMYNADDLAEEVAQVYGKEF